MKKIIISFLLISLTIQMGKTQNTTTYPKYGNTLNIGLGVGGYSGYYRYVGRSLPVLSVNYEIDVAKNFTLAPFISFYSYRNNYYWGTQRYPDRAYYYTETVIPIGLKGTYYLDQLLKVNSKWDIYIAASLGFAIVRQKWAADYTGDRKYYSTANPFFIDAHLGAEYHLNSKAGLFLDLSNGVSSIGIAIH